MRPGVDFQLLPNEINYLCTQVKEVSETGPVFGASLTPPIGFKSVKCLSASNTPILVFRLEGEDGTVIAKIVQPGLGDNLTTKANRLQQAELQAYLDCAEHKIEDVPRLLPRSSPPALYIECCQGYQDLLIFDQTFLQNGNFSAAEIAVILQQITRRILAILVQFYQNTGKIHGDIKPDNILVRMAGGRMDVKIIDWAFTRSATDKINKRFGTDFYMAPEVVEKNNQIDYTAIDIYSLFMTLFYIFFSNYDQVEELWRRKQSVSHAALACLLQGVVNDEDFGLSQPYMAWFYALAAKVNLGAQARPNAVSLFKHFDSYFPAFISLGRGYYPFEFLIEAMHFFQANESKGGAWYKIELGPSDRDRKIVITLIKSDNNVVSLRLCLEPAGPSCTVNLVDPKNADACRWLVHEVTAHAHLAELTEVGFLPLLEFGPAHSVVPDTSNYIKLSHLFNLIQDKGSAIHFWPLIKRILQLLFIRVAFLQNNELTHYGLDLNSVLVRTGPNGTLPLDDKDGVTLVRLEYVESSEVLLRKGMFPFLAPEVVVFETLQAENRLPSGERVNSYALYIITLMMMSIGIGQARQYLVAFNDYNKQFFSSQELYRWAQQLILVLSLEQQQFIAACALLGKENPNERASVRDLISNGIFEQPREEVISESAVVTRSQSCHF